jgi:adenosylhomocysteine nucleosidase
MDSEFHFLTRSLLGRGYEGEAVEIGKLTALHFPALQLTVAPSGHGKTQSALQTQYLLDRYEGITAVIQAGAAGALAPELEVGDIILAESTFEHDYRLRFVTRPNPQFPGSPALIEQFMPTTTLPFAVHRGISASGDEDVIDVVRGQELRAQTDGLAVSWEGAGVARVCQFNDLPFLEIRGISDNANHNAFADFMANLEAVMANIAALLIQGTIIS